MTQLDFAAELAQLREAKPDAVFVFYPGGFAINFVKQYAQAGLAKDIPLYSASSIDGTTLKAIGDAALGTFQTASYHYDFDNPANKKFREAFVRKYNYEPTFYSAYGFDAVQLLDSGIKAVKGNISDKPALIAALEKAEFSSVRGSFRFNPSHFAVQDFYLLEVVGQGGQVQQVTRQKVLSEKTTHYSDECKMPKP
jgi:branched-chain amino acid transport system substrate-binding protein